jgi:FMN phosphatase YigB (HAD superfamily)
MSNSLNPAAVQAIIFDYGNTIIPYGRPELTQYGAAVFAAMEANYGSLDRVRFDALRQASRMDPYAGDPPKYRENDMSAITAMLVRELVGNDPTPGELDQLLQARHDAFVEGVGVDSETVAALKSLASRYPLGLLSNYPDGPAIRASLERLGLKGLFKSVVVSGELGYVKPHPIMFAKSVEEMEVAAPSCLFVGDNWLADVQGAKAVGMQVAHMTRWNPPEEFVRAEADYHPDMCVGGLGELVAELLP